MEAVKFSKSRPVIDVDGTELDADVESIDKESLMEMMNFLRRKHVGKKDFIQVCKYARMQERSKYACPYICIGLSEVCVPPLSVKGLT